MTEVARSKVILRNRVLRLLRLGNTKDQSELTTRIFPFLLSLGEVALVGGAVRDVARAGMRGFSSDLDFVVYGTSSKGFKSAMEKRHAKPNRFGGYAINFFQWKIDIWHLDDTWARKAGLREVNSPKDLLHCTFFDWDSVVFDLRSRHLICESDYLRRLQSGIMDLELEENPNQDGALVRALRRAAMWQIRFGPRLTAFALRQLAAVNWGDILAREKGAFSSSILPYLEPGDILERLQYVEEVNGQWSTQPIPNWVKQPQLPLTSPSEENFDLILPSARGTQYDSLSLK